MIAAPGGQAGDRGQVDDRAALAGHGGNRGLGEVEVPGDVHGQHPLPQGIGGLKQRRVRVEDPRVVDEDVQAPEGALSQLDRF
jgi:hypothetical protein